MLDALNEGFGLRNVNMSCDDQGYEKNEEGCADGAAVQEGCVVMVSKRFEIGDLSWQTPPSISHCTAHTQYIARTAIVLYCIRTRIRIAPPEGGASGNRQPVRQAAEINGGPRSERKGGASGSRDRRMERQSKLTD